MKHSERGSLFWPATAAFYLFTLLLLTWPLVVNLRTHLVGRTTDSMVHYWNGWWAGQALRSGFSLFYTPLLSYPDGTSLLTHNSAWFNTLGWLLTAPLVGDIVAYNVVILGQVLLCGLAAAWLVWELISSRPAAFLAGLIYMAWPYRLSQLDHPNLISTFFVPLFFLFLERSLRTGSRHAAIIAGLFLAGVGYTRWQLLLGVGPLALVYLVGRWRQWRRREELLNVLLTGAVAFMLLLPPALALVREQQSSDFAADMLYEVDEQTMTADLLAYFTPGPRHVLLNERTEVLYDGYYHDRTPGRRYPAYVGSSVLLVAVWGVVRQWRQTWMWLVMALAVVGLAAGFSWRIAGAFTDAVPTLYRAVAPLEFARFMREPERYVIFLALPIAVLFAYGWHEIATRIRKTASLWLLTIVVAGVIALEYASVPVQMIDVDYDRDFWQALPVLEEAPAVLNLPLRFRFSKEYMFDQTVHARPILQGHVSREPEGLYRLLLETPWLVDLDEPPADPGRLLAHLQQEGVGYLVLNKYLQEPSTWQNWRRQVPFAPRYEDDRYLVYTTSPAPGVDYPASASVAPGLQLLDGSLESLCMPNDVAVVAHMTWASEAVPPVDYELTLHEQNATAESPAPVPLVADWPSSSWPRFVVTQQAYTLTLPSASLPAVVVADVTAAGVAAPVYSVPLGEVSSVLCKGAGALEPIEDVSFGDIFQLLGYRLETQNESLHVELGWLARSRPVRDYKFFVHLIDPSSGQIVAQADVVPDNWRFPTSVWRDGELLVDELAVSLAGVGPGVYEVQLGVYDAQSGRRLVPAVGDGRLQVTADNRLRLPNRILVDDP